MNDTPDPKTPWTSSPTAKARNAVQRSVTALLDELAPERVLTRSEGIPPSIEQFRTPSGCVLQAPGSALSVSWFAESSGDSVLGELHVVVWQGTVQRRGAPKSRKGASEVSELILRPIQPVTDECVWQEVNGPRHDTSSLVSKCLALLEAQIGVTG